MEEPTITTNDLLSAWRDALRAAELADRLAAEAAQAVSDADARAVASADLASLAEQASAAAGRAAARATAAANEASEIARRLRDETLVEAVNTATSSRDTEAVARDAFHEAEAKTPDT